MSENRKIDEIYRDLEQAGKTDVDNLIKWMKDSHVMKAANEGKIRKLFTHIQNQHCVELSNFMTVITKLAKEQHKTMEQITKQLADEAPKILDAAVVGLNAFKEALDKDKK